jgi:hypothetical protein
MFGGTAGLNARLTALSRMNSITKEAQKNLAPQESRLSHSKRK